MENYLQEQKKVAQFIRSLEEDLEVLQKSQIAAGWGQRNAIYAHVNANYTLQEKVLNSKGKWEHITFQCNVLQGILKLLLPHRDIYGIYNISDMRREFEELLKLAEKKEEYEIAELIHHNNDRFLYAVTTRST